MKRNNFFAGLRRAVLFFASLVTATAGAQGVPSALLPYAASSYHTPPLVRTSRDLGPTDSDTDVHLKLWLKLHQSQELEQLALDLTNPHSPRYRHWLSAREFQARFAPTLAEIAKVQQFLQKSGFAEVTVDPGHLFVTARGNAANAQQLFQVELRQFEVGGKTVMANTSDPNIAPDISDLVMRVGGLSTQSMRTRMARRKNHDTSRPLDTVPVTPTMSGTQHETVCFRKRETHDFTTAGALPKASYSGIRYGGDLTEATPLPSCGYGPSEIQTAYGIKALHQKGIDGRGETIVIVDAFGSPTIAEDVKAFTHLYGLPDLQLTVYQPAGAPVKGAWDDNQQGWAGETSLDVEYAHVMAPGAKIALVETPTDSDDDLVAGIAYAVENNLGNVISNSFGDSESVVDDSTVDVYKSILEMAAVRGFAINVSSGDDGDMISVYGYSDVGFPSNLPFATSIGGTSLALNADHSIRFQAAWGTNYMPLTDGVTTPQLGASAANAPLATLAKVGFDGGSGGGASRSVPKPYFQKNVVGTTRMQPDISYVADAYTGVEVVESNFDSAGNPQPATPTITITGGTSVSCPLFSGLWALGNQMKHGSLGEAAPLLYMLPSDSITDILPYTSPDNVVGSITDASGTTPQIALELAKPQTASPFLSTLLNSSASPFKWEVVTFGTDSTLAVTEGWDPATGLGVPNGERFLRAVVGN